MWKILPPLDEGVNHVKQKNETQEGKEPVLPGIKVIPVRIFIFGDVIGKDNIGNRIIINDI